MTQATAHTEELAVSGKQPFDYVLVLDFEATCEDKVKKWPSEIIEVPVVALCTRTWRVVAEFHEYARPVVRPRLTDFCTRLTGIAQATVDAADPFPLVLQRLVAWCERFGADRPGSRLAVLTCGDWDLKQMLPEQLERCAEGISGTTVPALFSRWINLKPCFNTRWWGKPEERELKQRQSSGKKRKAGLGMAGMLRALDLPLVGRHHSGIDDARNIAAIAAKIGAAGVRLDLTGTWTAEQIARWCPEES